MNPKKISKKLFGMPKSNNINKKGELVTYAENELKRIGLLKKTSIYNDQIGKDVLALINLFSKQEHSGGSAYRVINLFSTLAKFQPLTPLTDDKKEWFLFYINKKTGEKDWQSTRNPSCFSNDGGKSYYNIDTKKIPKWKFWIKTYKGFKLYKSVKSKKLKNKEK